MHRTHMGVDQDYVNITKQFSRTALADGWGGSMVATEIPDICSASHTGLVEVNMGVLKEDQVNIIVHGHEPSLFESMIESVNEPTLVQAPRPPAPRASTWWGCAARAPKCWSATVFPMPETSCRPRRSWSPARSTPWASTSSASSRFGQGGRMLRYEAHHHQPARSHRGRYPHPFDDHNPKECTDELVIQAISRFKNRTAKIEIPKIENIGVHGFSHEYINYMLGGTFRAILYAAERQHHQRPDPRVAGVVGLHQPAGSSRTRCMWNWSRS